MDQKAYPYVLLEAVALAAEADWRTDQTRCAKVPRDSDGVKQERLLASCENAVKQLRLVERASSKAGASVTTNIVDSDYDDPFLYFSYSWRNNRSDSSLNSSLLFCRSSNFSHMFL